MKNKVIAFVAATMMATFLSSNCQAQEEFQFDITGIGTSFQQAQSEADAQWETIQKFLAITNLLKRFGGGNIVGLTIDINELEDQELDGFNWVSTWRYKGTIYFDGHIDFELLARLIQYGIIP